MPNTNAWAGLAASVTLALGEPTSIKPGQITTLEITLSNNNSAADITNLAFSNSLPGTLPNGLKVAAAPTYECYDPGADTTIPGSGTLTAAIGSQAIQLVGGDIPMRDTTSGKDGLCTISIPVTAGSSTGSGTAYTYTIANNAVSGNDGAAVSNSGSVSQSINVIAIFKPTIAKAFNNATAILGGAARTLTITLTNTNDIAIPNFNISDTFPVLGSGGAVIKVANPPNLSASCNNGGTAPTFNAASDDVILNATGTIPAKAGVTNGSCTLKVDVVGVHTNGTYSTGVLTNTINAVSNFNNDLGINAGANATANITVTSPLNVTKSFTPSSLADGQTGRMTITLSNNATSDLTVTTFADSPIDGLIAPAANKGLGVTAATTTCAGGSASITTLSGKNPGVELNGGTIPAGGSCKLEADFTATTQQANTPISYTNNIIVGAVGVTTTGIFSQSTSASILVADTLRVLKTNNASNPRPGNPAQYSVTVQNWSAADMTNVTITDALQNGMTF